MPKSLEDIIAHGDEYAAIFEAYEPREEDRIDVDAYRELSEAALARTHAEVRLAEAVAGARAGNMKWNSIGAILGTSGEAARQRYGALKRAKP
jgi:hypothetical protein